LANDDHAPGGIRAGIIVTSVEDDRDSGLRAIFAELRFPAPLWLLIAQAHSWGADVECVDNLNDLPVKDYQRLDDVLHALDQQPSTRSKARESTSRG
jgi:hypothetical protein